MRNVFVAFGLAVALLQVIGRIGAEGRSESEIRVAGDGNVNGARLIQRRQDRTEDNGGGERANQDRDLLRSWR